MTILIRFWAILACLALSACQTPNLQPWANNTATLNAAVSTEHEAVLARLAAAKAEIETWDSSNKKVMKLDQTIETYETNAKKIETVLNLAVSYSNALTELAIAGESGEEAANQIIESFQKFTEAANLALPGAGAAGDIIANVLRSVSEAVTRIQAQKSLEVAMDVAENGNPEEGIPGPIPAIETYLNEMFKKFKEKDGVKEKAGAQRFIVSGLQGTQDDIALDIAGFNRVTFYKGVNVKKPEILGVKATRLDHYFAKLNEQIGKQYPLDGLCAKISDQEIDCLTGRTAEGLAAIVALVGATEANYKAYIEAISNNAKFAQQRKGAADKIVAAVKSWRKEHKRIADRLRECSGLKSLRSSCGNLTFANFKSAVEKLKNIAGKGGN